MQLDPLQQATQFSVSPRRMAATPRRASMFARNAPGQSESITCASANRRSASVNSPTDMWRSPRKVSSWTTCARPAGVCRSTAASSCRSRLIPLSPRHSSDIRTCSSDCGSVIGSEYRMASPWPLSSIQSSE